MPKNDNPKWARGWNTCRNCDTTRRPHKARGYCNLCYRLIQKLSKIDSWTPNDFPHLLWSSPHFLDNNISAIKDACKAQVNVHLKRVHGVENKLNGSISGLDIEYQLKRISAKIRVPSGGKRTKSLYHGVADYIEGNFNSTQRHILYMLLNKIEDQTRTMRINWNAVWKKL
jgi:hypothetical protein